MILRIEFRLLVFGGNSTIGNPLTNDFNFIFNKHGTFVFRWHPFFGFMRCDSIDELAVLRFSGKDHFGIQHGLSRIHPEF